MPFNADITEELNVLALFNADTTQGGLKIHSSARSEVIAAAKRLFDKALITQVDGGYLTELGRTAAGHSEDLLSIIRD